MVSTTLDDADAWQNSVLLRGDPVRTVEQLKASDGPDLAIVGSAALVRSLHQAGLIDSYALLIHPLVLGEGRRLFEESSLPAEFVLTGTVATGAGVIIASYERGQPSRR